MYSYVYISIDGTNKTMTFADTADTQKKKQLKENTGQINVDSLDFMTCVAIQQWRWFVVISNVPNSYPVDGSSVWAHRFIIPLQFSSSNLPRCVHESIVNVLA